MIVFACLGGVFGPPRTVASWRADGLGDHRVRFYIGQGLVDQPCVLDVQWRLPLGLRVGQHALTVHDERGRTLKQAVALEASDDHAVLLLRSRAAGTHFLYFLPYDGGRCAETGPASACRVEHTHGKPTRPLPRWLPTWARNHTPGAPLDELMRTRLAQFARANVLAIEARSERDTFGPMEVRATPAELAALRESAAGRQMLLFAEPHSRPIRMRDAPLAEWARAPMPLNATEIALEAGSGAYLAFQIAALALLSRDPLRGLAVAFEELRYDRHTGGDSIGTATDVALGPRAFRLLNRCGGHAEYLDLLAGLAPTDGASVALTDGAFVTSSRRAELPAAPAGGFARRVRGESSCGKSAHRGGADGLTWVASNQASVAPGHVGVLWVAVDLPSSLPAGQYSTRVAVRADGVATEHVTVRLRVTAELASPDRGDAHPEGHSRLRWLESSAGVEPTPTRGYGKVTWAFENERPARGAAEGGARGAGAGEAAEAVWLYAGDKALRLDVAGLAGAQATSGRGGGAAGAASAAPDVRADVAAAAAERGRALLLPSALKVRGTDLLASPMRLLLDAAGAQGERTAEARPWVLLAVRSQRAPTGRGPGRGSAEASAAGGAWESRSDAEIRWSAVVEFERQPARGGARVGWSAPDVLEVSLAASFEFDGYVELELSLRAPAPSAPATAGAGRGAAQEADAVLVLDDFAVELALLPAVAQLVSGLGRPGGNLERYVRQLPASGNSSRSARARPQAGERAPRESGGAGGAGGSNRRRLPAEWFADGSGSAGSDGVGSPGSGSIASNEWVWGWADEAAAANRRPGLNGRLWLGSASAGVQLSLAPRAGFDDGATLAAAVEAVCDSDGAAAGGGDDDGKDGSGRGADSGEGRDRRGEGIGSGRAVRAVCAAMADQQYAAALGSASWANGGRGRVRVSRRAAAQQGKKVEGEAVVLTASTGKLKLLRGAAAVRFPVRLLLTPVRPAPLRAPIRSRHFHMQRFVSVEAAAAHVPGGTIIIHQVRARAGLPPRARPSGAFRRAARACAWWCAQWPLARSCAAGSS